MSESYKFDIAKMCIYYQCIGQSSSRSTRKQVGESFYLGWLKIQRGTRWRERRGGGKGQ